MSEKYYPGHHTEQGIQKKILQDLLHGYIGWEDKTKYKGTEASEKQAVPVKTIYMDIE